MALPFTEPALTRQPPPVQPVLVPAFRRAKKDPIARLIAAAAAAGVRFRFAGAALELAGTHRLHPADKALLRDHLTGIRNRLAPPAVEGPGVLGRLGVRFEYIVDPDRARAVIETLPDAVGLDCETSPLPEFAPPPRWLVITKDGRRAVHQPVPRDRTALDPTRARPRLVQVYDPKARIVFVLDLRHVPMAALAGLWDRKCVAHNAGFELVMLDLAPREIVDTLQLAGLVLGCAPGARSLANVAELILGIPLPKSEQVSDWSADRLSRAQVEYAAADAAVCYEAAKVMRGRLDAQARWAFAVQNAAVPIAARMRLQGVPFDAGIHAGVIREWEHRHAEERERFREITGEDVPGNRQAIAAWLEARLPDEDRAWWPRTTGGLLSTQGDFLARLGAYPEIRPLLVVLERDKLIRSFGHKLIAAISPMTGRIHPDLMVCGSKAGRFTCSSPNLQQLAPDARRAVVAPAGRALVTADYGQIELRVIAELAQDETMRRAFAGGEDLHRLTAAAIAGVPLEEVTRDQRQAAKAVNFGAIYGQGAKGLVATAWANYRVELTIEEAERAQEAFFGRYPALRPWQQALARRVEAEGVVRTVLGRPIRAEWERTGRLRFNQIVNLPVQGGAADVTLVALPKIAAALAGLDAQLVLTVHDEFVVEAAEEDAAEAARRLARAMIEAFQELFPEAPIEGLVDVRIGHVWAKG